MEMNIRLLLMAYLVLSVHTLDSSNATTSPNLTEEISTNNYEVEVPTPPHSSMGDMYGPYIYDFSDVLHRVKDYDYYLLDPGDASRKGKKKHASTFWGCFKKTNVIMEGKQVNSKTKSGEASIEKCGTMCSLNGRCQMWSFDQKAVDGSNCYHQIETDEVEKLRVEYTQDAELEFRTCSSDYIGCYIGLRTETAEYYVTQANDVHSCTSKCKQKEYPYALVKDSEYCECSHSFPSPQITDKNIKCIIPTKHSDRFAIYKTGSEYTDTTVCIIASDMDYESEGSIYHTGITSPLSCKTLCENYQDHGKTCLMWWYNVTYCKIIPKSVNGGHFIRSSHSYIGFATCGDKEKTKNESCSDTGSNNSDNGTEERNTKIAFGVAFCAVFLFLMLAIVYVCGCLRVSALNTKSPESSKDFSNSNNIQSEIHIGKNGLVALSDNKLKEQKAKKRYVNVFSKPSIAFISTPSKSPTRLRPDIQHEETEMNLLTHKGSDGAGCAHQTEYVTLDTYNKMKNNHHHVEMEPESTE